MPELNVHNANAVGMTLLKVEPLIPAKDWIERKIKNIHARIK
jgi:hypothetical protein